MRKVKKLDELSPEERHIQPFAARNAFDVQVPKFEIGEQGMEPRRAYEIIHDELMLDGNARLNLATFVTTYMDPEAERLMAETFDKNMT